MSKKLVCVALILCWGLVSASWADLVGHWKFDEGSGTVAADASGNGYDGTAEGDPQWVPGMIGGALEFDGDDAVNCGDILSLTEGLSIACWVNPAGLSGDNSWVAREGCYAFKSGGLSLKFTTPGILDHTATNTTLEIGDWQHVAVTFAPGQAEGVVFYLNGAEAQRLNASAINPGNEPFLVGNNQWSQFYEGQIDDVRVYDDILNEAEIKAAMIGTAVPYAITFEPRNGSMISATQTTLQWRPGDFAVSHNVYLGTDSDAVANATPDDADLFVGSTGDVTMSVQTLVPGQTYYWRVEAINDAEPDSPWKGEVSTFWVQPDIAWSPTPADGIPYIDPDQDLTWKKGLGALFHTVYLGESFDEVNDAVAGGMMIADATYDPGTLELGKTYYWRVDEFVSPQTNKGEVWSFTTLPEIPVTDESLLAWWTLDEGVGTNVVDWSGHGHHGTLGDGARWADGYFGSAMYFDGSGDHVDFGTPQDLYLPQNYTYTAWFQVGRNISGNSGAQYLLCIGSRSDLIFGVEDGVGVDGDLMLHYYDTAPGFHAVGVGKTTWSADEWHMVAGTRDETGHSIYLDGELRNFDTNTNEDNYATTRIISLGGRAWTGHQWYNGLIDDVRIYNRALD
ncbi:MAG: LamG domain-containing protein, partial [Sedimentisphaerales bacterium]|nr:LamG domain-containing protein [Sedimentisphaerales bacterium]